MEHKTLENFTLQKVKTGWLVTIKGNHKLEGVWHFSNRDAAIDFLNSGSKPGSGGAKRTISTLLIRILLIAISGYLIYLIVFNA